MDKQKIIDEARNKYMEFLPTLLVMFPDLSKQNLEYIQNLKSIAVISRTTIQTAESLKDYIVKQLVETKNYTFNDKNNFVISTPTDHDGSSTYVVFEIQAQID